jgi:hypothetical protein
MVPGGGHMRNTSVQKFYTENIHKYFGLNCSQSISQLDSILERPGISLKWKSVHQDYLTSSEALVLGIKILNDEPSQSQSAHEMFDHALNTDKSDSKQLIFLAMGIFYFRKALSEQEHRKQKKILMLSEYYIRESISLNDDCSISKLHLVLVKVALKELHTAVKELVKFAKKTDESRAYEMLFKIYESMERPNVALYYSLKASKAKNMVIL